MLDLTQGRMARRIAPVILLVGLVACSKQEDKAATTTPATGATPAATAPTPATAVSPQVQSMAAEQLRESATKALQDNRMYAPAGDNAVEYYLALREKQPQDATVNSALTDLLPYTLIAAEQGISREEFPEAQRLIALIEKVDPQAPALPRLKSGLETGMKTAANRSEQDAEQAKKQVEDKAKQAAEQKRLAEQQSREAAAAQQIAAQQEAARQQTAEAERQAAARRQAEAPAPTPAAPRPAPGPASGAGRRRCSRTGRAVAASDQHPGTALPGRSAALGYLGRSAGGTHGRYRRLDHRLARAARQPAARVRPRSPQRGQALALRTGGRTGDHAAYAVLQSGRLMPASSMTWKRKSPQRCGLLRCGDGALWRWCVVAMVRCGDGALWRWCSVGIARWRVPQELAANSRHATTSARNRQTLLVIPAHCRIPQQCRHTETGQQIHRPRL